jgi:hypothetical protein
VGSTACHRLIGCSGYLRGQFAGLSTNAPLAICAGIGLLACRTGFVGGGFYAPMHVRVRRL